MLRTTRRLVTIVIAAAALIALYAFAAQAANPAAGANTLPATSVSANAAVLHGTISTFGQASEWQFQYGTSKGYGRGTPLEFTPAGGGTFPVSAKIKGLKPNTTYHFRLLVGSGIGTKYIEIDYGRDRSFKTRARGRMLLLSKQLGVTNGHVTAILKCASPLACSGRYSIDTRAGLAKTHNAASVVCTTTFFTIKPGHTAGINGKMQSACLVLLAAAPNHRISARFSSAPRTGQLGLIDSVILASS